jgi:phthalate 4,5-dioxygenase oxygenase subunit
MLTREENELMCRVGPGSAMGAAMRRYWLPALHSSALPHADCDPQHVELLGEHFVAFRDTNGQVGLLDEQCCHRGASLLLGRVEECGIRCIYHGWKFAVDGTVLDTPNVPDPKFKNRIRARAYPVREAGGLIWVYLGAADKLPPFPEWPWTKVDEAHRLHTVHVQECNFVQVIEGLVDSSHLGILHSNGLRASGDSQLSFATKVGAMQFDLSPRIEEEETRFGFHYAALRAATDEAGEHIFARVTAFVVPCVVLNPNGDVATIVVPNNDVRCTFFHVFWDAQRAIGEEPLRSDQLKFIGLDVPTASGYGLQGAASTKPSRTNRYLQDREAMRNGLSFSGMPGLVEEDIAASVSAGPVRDRSREALALSDAAVNRLYRVLIKCAKAEERGQDPIGVYEDVSQVRGTIGRLQKGGNWRSLVPAHLSRSSTSPAGASL